MNISNGQQDSTVPLDTKERYLGEEDGKRGREGLESRAEVSDWSFLASGHHLPVVTDRQAGSCSWCHD